MTDKPFTPERIQKHMMLRLKVEDLAYGGKGVAKIDNFVFFVQNAVPGDLVQARVTRRQPNFAEAVVAELIEPSPRRVEPKCPLFGTCGGCSWQSLSYDDQLVYKQKIAESTIAHLGKARPERVEPIIPSPTQWRYRNKMDYTFGTNSEGQPIIGFHYPGCFDQIFEVKQCYLQPEPFDALLGAMTAWVREKRLTSYDPRPHKGFLRHLIIRHSVATGDIIAVLLTDKGNLPDPDGLVAALRKACPALKGFVWGLNTGLADFVRQDREMYRWGEPYLEETLEDLTFKVSPFSFFQVNTRAAEKLYAVAREYLGDDARSARLLDAYCGTGTIGIFCASRVQDVIGVEVIRDAIWDARQNAERNGKTNCTFLVGDMRQTLPLLPSLPGPVIGRIIVDPPRGGMDKHALRGLLALQAPVIVYVSCNPATLSRDIATAFESGYRATAMQPVDLFPQTYHIETVVRLDKD